MGYSYPPIQTILILIPSSTPTAPTTGLPSLSHSSLSNALVEENEKYSITNFNVETSMNTLWMNNSSQSQDFLNSNLSVELFLGNNDKVD